MPWFRPRRARSSRCVGEDAALAVLRIDGQPGGFRCVEPRERDAHRIGIVGGAGNGGDGFSVTLDDAEFGRGEAGERSHRVFILRGGNAVGNIGERAGGRAVQRLGDRFGRAHAVGHKRLRLGGGKLVQRHCGRCRHGVMFDIGGEADGDGAVGPFRIADQGLRRCHASFPIGCGGPAIIDHEHQRAGAGNAVIARVHHGVSKRKNDGSGQRHAQQCQPPRAFGGRFLALQHSCQNFQRRKHFRLGARRGEPQQPPDGGQRQKAEENIRAGENEGQCAHRRPPPCAGAPDKYM